tara:strand:- start:64658 stop:66622 length:1965 start_codon:yes stop_codon:yes gene_type:complete
MKFRSTRLSKKNLFYTPSTRKNVSTPKKPRSLKPLRWIWRNYLKVCTFLGFMIILSTVISTLVMNSLTPSGPVDLPPKMVLQMTLKGSIPETPQKDPVLAALGISKASLYEIINALKTAKTDDQIAAFILEFKAGGYPPSQLAELREAIADFKTSGKPTIVFAPSYDIMSTGISSYFLASVFDEIWMQPIGMVSMSGYYSEQPYFRKTLDWLGVNPQVFQRKEYKSAMDSMNKEHMTPESREAMSALLGDFHDTLTKAISDSRDIPANTLEGYINKGTLTDQEAMDAQLVDRLGYGDELVTEFNERLGGTKEEKIPYISLDHYITYLTHGSINPLYIISKMTKKHLGYKQENKGEIALIFAQGTIVQYAPETHKFDMGSNAIAADEVAKWIYDATFNDNIKTIVLRIDSPGGSPQASETIRRALERAKDEGKRVIVSMGSMAASGGYWIACVADHIFANEMTITGSIGVIGAQFDLSGLWSKLLVNWDSISTAENADLNSMSKPLSDSAKARYNTMMDSIYDAFLNRVAEGRNLSYSSVDEIARGRVWSGKRALDIKLIDSLGGLNDALLWAAKDLGHEDIKSAGVVIVPSPRAGLDAILSLLGVSAGKMVKVATQLDDLHALTEVAPVESLMQIQQDLAHQQNISVYTPNPIR